MRAALRGRGSSTLLALSLAALWILLPLRGRDVWDPYELDTFDLARRIAVHAFGAADLARPGDPPAIPTLTDLGMGELPYTSMALSFAVFGATEWAGRLALALWAVAGAMSLYALLARTVSARAGLLGVAVLVTMPLFAEQARTMLGDIVTLAAFSMAFSGLTLALVERSRAAAAAWAALGALGLAAGFLSRGLLVGVAAPCLSVGLAGLAGARLAARDAGRRRVVVGASALLVLVAAACVVRFGALLPEGGAMPPVDREIGFSVYDPTPRDSTFDRVIRQLGHALFPWSAILPLAFARLLRPAPEGGGGSAAAEPFVRIALLAASITAVAAGTFVVPYAGPIACSGVAALAGAVGVALCDLDRGARTSVVAAASVAILGALLYVDFTREPGRLLAPHALVTASFPPGFADRAAGWLRIALAIFVSGSVLALSAPRTTDPLRPGDLAGWIGESVRLGRARARAFGREIVSALDGNVLFFLVVLEAGLVGLGAMLFIGSRARWASIAELPRSMLDAGMNAWWMAPMSILGLASAWFVARLFFDAALGLSRAGRGTSVAVLGAAAGTVLGFVMYPALARELSPASVFDTYRAVRRDGDELGLYGVSPRVGTFYAGESVPVLPDERVAAEWLGAAGHRRFLIVKTSGLPRLNSLWRGDHGQNLPVLDATTSENLLVSNVLGPGPNQNPLGDVVLDHEPSPSRPIEARFLDHIETIGWEVRDDRGGLVSAVEPRKTYKVRFYYRVLERPAGAWQAFLHIDAKQVRTIGDHDVAGGRYPMTLWQTGDVISDEVEITVEPNFPPGEAWVFFGFFQGSTRMKVTDGPQQDNRVIAGRLTVR